MTIYNFEEMALIEKKLNESKGIYVCKSIKRPKCIFKAPCLYGDSFLAVNRENCIKIHNKKGDKFFILCSNGNFETSSHKLDNHLLFDLDSSNSRGKLKEMFDRICESLGFTEKEMLDFFLKNYEDMVKEGTIKDMRK